ncbi:hypothetical protein DFS33DRAFT_1388724 [Desarmillaria ectypa]|nr:hypothetical protein DFS33DRAFT_1388724 [Desarmillaria ectypa]
MATVHHSPNPPIVYSFPSVDKLIGSFAELIIEAQREFIDRKGKFTITLIKWDKGSICLGLSRIRIFLITFRHSRMSYATSTRAVSIPAPVHDVDMVCSRANHHFPPDSHLGSDEDWSASLDTDSETPMEIIDKNRKYFKPVHKDQRRRMYFQSFVVDV